MPPVRRFVSRPSLLASLAVTVLVWLAGSTQALAKRVLLNRFTGPGAARMKAPLGRALARRHRLVGKIKQADAVINATVTKKGRRFSLRLVVNDRRTAAKLGEETYTLRAARLDNRTAAKAANDLSPYIDDAGRQGNQERVQPEEIPAAPKPVAQPRVEPEPPPPKQVAQAETAPAAGAESNRAEAVVVAQPAERRPPWMSPADIGLVFLLVTRNFQMTNAGAPVRPNYTNANPVGGLGFEGSLYPFVFARSRSFADGFGLRFTYGRTLLLKSSLQSAPDTKFDSAYQELTAALTYRIFFVKKPWTPVLIPRVGFSRVSFDISYGAGVAAADLLPNVAYLKFMVGVEAWIPFGTTIIGAYISADGRIGGGAGDLTTTAGAGSANGFEAAAGLAGRIWKGLGYRGTYNFSRYAINFNGMHTIATMGVDAATETFQGGQILLTYTF